MNITITLPNNNPFATKSERVYRVTSDTRKRALHVLPDDNFTLLDALSKALKHCPLEEIKMYTYGGTYCGIMHREVIDQLKTDGEP